VGDIIFHCAATVLRVLVIFCAAYTYIQHWTETASCPTSCH